ncbi:cytochrome P450 [Mycena maculata]|uniref:Cytochrome P450 n=1 Tax=Mycena maculata TaxID=230809 RepID=A0AAD7JRS7_9AGAR|nr:cytochrome P450 [Mycena maculata]
MALAFTLLAASIVPFLFRKNIRNANGILIPPGPLLCYAFLRKYPERALSGWAKKFDPLFFIWMGNQLFVMISDPKIAHDLLGAIFSSRKQYFMKNQTILAGRAIAVSPYDDKWQHHRRLAMQLLTPKAIQTYADVLDYEPAILVRSFYDKSNKGTLPRDPANYAGRYGLNNMLTISLGTCTTRSTTPLIEWALQLAMEFVDLTGPFSKPIDFITSLQWIPTRTRTRGRQLHRAIIEVYRTMYQDVKVRMDAGEIVPECLVRTLIEMTEIEKLDWTDTCMLAAVFTLSGVHSVCPPVCSNSMELVSKIRSTSSDVPDPTEHDLGRGHHWHI